MRLLIVFNRCITVGTSDKWMKYCDEATCAWVFLCRAEVDNREIVKPSTFVKTFPPKRAVRTTVHLFDECPSTRAGREGANMGIRFAQSDEVCQSNSFFNFKKR